MLVQSKKRKGHKLEKFVKEEFEAIGWRANFQPGSGIYQGFPHDVRVLDSSGQEWIIECKAHKSPFKTLLEWIGLANFLVFRPNQGEAWIMMRLKDFQRLPFVNKDTPKTA